VSIVVSQAIHGLEAYSGRNKPIHSLIAQANAINAIGDGEICTSNKLIGKIGVVVDAVHTVAIDGDVWSGVVGIGKRVFCPSENPDRAFFTDTPPNPEKWAYEDEDWTVPTGLSNHCLRRAALSAQKKGRYAEFFASKPQVRCVVFDEKATKMVAKRARVLARALKTVAMPIAAETPLAAYQEN